MRQEIGRVKGYRPTAGQFRELLELAQRDFDPQSARAIIRYQYGKNHVTLSAEEEDPDPIIQFAALPTDDGKVNELTDLRFEVNQAEQLLRVEVHVGAGDFTHYEVESSNDTWARGRYQQLTEKLLADRTLYAKAMEPMPEVPKKQHGWKLAPWEPRRDWRLGALGLAALAPYAIALLVLALAFIAPLHTTGHDSSRLTYTAPAPHTILACIAILVSLFAYDRWRRTLLKSRVIVTQYRWIAKFNFRNQQTGPVAVMSFYVACIAILVAIVLKLG